MIYLLQLPQSSDNRNRAAAERQAGWALFRFALFQKAPELAFLPLQELIRFGTHGKPYLKTPLFFFSLSHSGGQVVCAVEDCEVGADIERKRKFSPRLARRICTPAEAAFIASEENADDALTRLWTMKESYMKYTGLGLAQGILQTEFSALGEYPRLALKGPCFRSVDLGSAFLTLCTERPVSLSLHRLDKKELGRFFKTKGYALKERHTSRPTLICIP